MRIAMLSVIFVLCASLAQATDWIHWVESTVIPARVNGVLNGQAVTFTSTGPMLSAQTGALGEPLYWLNNAATYTGGGSVNPPVTSDLVRLVGPGVHTLTFAQPVTGLVMAIISMGGAISVGPITFDFGAHPFTLLKTGPGHFGNRTPLTRVNNILTGHESSGLIQFTGTISTVTWTQPVGETWTGFTIGVVPENPRPPALSPMLHAGLEWLYAPADEAALGSGGFRLYEGTNQLCDLPAPLPLAIADIPSIARTYARRDIPIEAVRVCYELTAFNLVGESRTRSNRATVSVADLIPAMPTGVMITNLVGN